MVTAMRAEAKVDLVGLHDISWDNHVEGALNPEQHTISFSEIQSILTGVPDILNQQIVTMAAQGYPCGAIAEFLGMNEHAVGERLRRIRRRNRGVRGQKGGADG
jgi:DNA-directed RNA polymerase specialized sigma24 family protein